MYQESGSNFLEKGKEKNVPIIINRKTRGKMSDTDALSLVR